MLTCDVTLTLPRQSQPHQHYNLSSLLWGCRITVAIILCALIELLPLTRIDCSF